MKKILPFVLLFLFSSIAFAQYVPPMGIPMPPIGVNEVPGIPSHIVDNSSIYATDLNNPNGTLDKPRRSIPTTIPAGAVVQVSGGPYTIYSRVIWTSQGTLAAPAFLVGVNYPTLRGSLGSNVVSVGSNLIVDGFVFDNVALYFSSTMSRFALRNSLVMNHSPGRNSSAIATAGSDLVFYKNEIRNNGDPNAVTEIDVIGINVQQPSQRVWILDNEMHHNGGDSILIGQATISEPYPHHIYIGRNRIHEDRENAVDIKRARDVIVSTNLMYGYVVRTSSTGEAIITHNGPQRIWIINNFVTLSQAGIVCSDAKDYLVLGNLVTDIKHNQALPYNPSNAFQAPAISTYYSTNVGHIGNTVWGNDSGINIPGPVYGYSEISNNIVGGLIQNVSPIRFVGTILYVFNNFTSGDPMFVNPAAYDYRVQLGSPVIDVGVFHWIYSEFEKYYGIPLNLDIYGNPRLFGVTFDVGAAENQGQ